MPDSKMYCKAQDRACEDFYARKASVRKKKVKKTNI